MSCRWRRPDWFICFHWVTGSQNTNVMEKWQGYFYDPSATNRRHMSIMDRTYCILGLAREKKKIEISLCCLPSVSETNHLQYCERSDTGIHWHTRIDIFEDTLVAGQRQIWKWRRKTALTPLFCNSLCIRKYMQWRRLSTLTFSSVRSRRLIERLFLLLAKNTHRRQKKGQRT